MSGKNKGVIKNIQDRCGKALGCHCQAHLLNLCVVSACKINSVVVMMNKLQCVQEFFDFPKGLSLLSGMIDECDLPQIKKKKLKDCCRTRWVQRVDSFTIFLDLFKVICDALSHISEIFKDFFSRKQPCRGMEEKFIQNHGISRNLQQTIRKIKNKK